DAKAELCDRYKQVLIAVNIETNGPDAGLARIALVNGAFIVDQAAANPALESEYRAAANALVWAYENMVVVASSGGTTYPPFDAALEEVIAKEQAVEDLCGH
ncbi:hypothetical protein ABQE43_06980, partial [Mycolicibacter minnesotensis]